MEEKELDILGLPKEPGFKTPERYFDQLPNRIMERTAYATPVGATSPVSWIRQWKPVFAVASMALIFVISYVTTSTLGTGFMGQKTSLVKITDQEIKQYLLNHADVEASDIAEFAAVTPPHSLEFIEVKHTDVNIDAAIELLEDRTESQSLLNDEL